MVQLICISVLLIADLLTNLLPQNANGNAFCTNCQLNVRMKIMGWLVTIAN